MVLLLLDGLSMAISGYKTPAHPLIFYGGLWRPGLIIALGGTKSPKILYLYLCIKTIQACMKFNCVFSAQISCNHLSIPLPAFMNMCVLNYNENWAPNHCIKMLIFILSYQLCPSSNFKRVSKTGKFCPSLLYVCAQGTTTSLP